MDRETGDSGKLREGIPMSDKEQIQQEKREARRRRRVRNQVVAYVVLVALILAAAAGTVYGVNYLTKNNIGFGKGDGAGGADDQQGGSEDQDRQDAIDDIFGSEGRFLRRSLPRNPLRLFRSRHRRRGWMRSSMYR